MSIPITLIILILSSLTIGHGVETLHVGNMQQTLKVSLTLGIGSSLVQRVISCVGVVFKSSDAFLLLIEDVS